MTNVAESTKQHRPVRSKEKRAQAMAKTSTTLFYTTIPSRISVTPVHASKRRSACSGINRKSCYNRSKSKNKPRNPFLNNNQCSFRPHSRSIHSFCLIPIHIPANIRIQMLEWRSLSKLRWRRGAHSAVAPCLWSDRNRNLCSEHRSS